METQQRLEIAYLSLNGLAVGDAYGNHHSTNQTKRQAQVWEWSDDTLMALSLVSNLRQFGSVHQDVLAQSFASRRDSQRGYGQGATQLLKRIASGTPWKTATYEMFDGVGSYGNGAAMRVAPLGAYFADDLEAVIKQAHVSAEVTHAHPEGIAGAISIAVAAAIALRQQAMTCAQFLNEVINHTPSSEVRSGLQRAVRLPADTSFKEASDVLGNGRPVIAQRTVPFTLWSAASYLHDYQLAITKTASIGGDVDTNCAIVGGIVALRVGLEGIPIEWRDCCESLPHWAFEEQV